jgi:hypoxanthine phosphoribosyltransferase
MKKRINMVVKTSNIKEVLISEEEIKQRTRELGEILTIEYTGKDLVLIGILKGCIPFISDLGKEIKTELSFDYMVAKSYHGGFESSNDVQILKDLDIDIENKHVLLVEDIIDTGQTIKKVVEILKSRNPESLKIVTLLDKKEGRKVDIDADYIGFDIPNKFVVGYGLDLDEKLRNVPFIGVYSNEE